MPWEYRARGGRHYTRSRRIDGVLTREYFGSGPLAEAAARADAKARQVLAAQRHAHATRHTLDRALDHQLDDLCRVTDHLIHLALTAAGYHQHARGHWRKAHVPTTSTTSTTSTPQPPTTPTPSSESAQRHFRHPASPASPASPTCPTSQTSPTSQAISGGHHPIE